MKKKIYLAVMAVAVISMAGWGKKIADTSAEATPEPTVTPTTTEEPEQNETQAEEVSSETDDTGVYYGNNEITELNVGLDTVVKCTIKVPLNYIITGAAYFQENTQKWLSDTGATVTVEHALKNGGLSDINASTLSVMSQGSDSTSINALMYSTAGVGSYEDLKQEFSDGKDVGTEDNPVWLYDAPENSYNPDADFVVLMPISDDSVLTIYYKGPLTVEEGKEVAAQKVCGLVTKK